MRYAILVILGLFMIPDLAQSQNRFDALRFSTQYPAGDAFTLSSGGSSSASFTGYGSALLNPATLGMAKSSSFNIGLGLRDISEDATYLGTTSSYDDSQTAFTNVGFVYAFPTVQGSLVFGGGYNQIADFNRAYRLNAFNDRSSITDLFFDNDFYFDTAFNAFAIEEDDFGVFPIFRDGLDTNFFGVDQTATVTESGQLGEFTASIATEFVEGLYVGAMLGIPVGSYSYKRDFLERDTQGFYGPIDTFIDGEPFTIPAPDNVILQERIDADITGFSARIGAIYRFIPQLSLGISYSLPTQYNIEESYSVFIQTSYEQGGSESDELRGETSYKVKTPSRLNFGIATHDLPVNITASVERVGNSSIQFRDFGDLGLEVAENDAIRDDFKDVYNLRFGATLNISDVVQPSVGYAYLPAVSRSSNNDTQFVSGGVRIGVNQNLSLDFGLQYAFFDDEQTVYEFFDYQAADGSFQAERVRTSADRFHAVIGVNFRF